MPSIVKTVAVGFTLFLAYSAANKLLVKPLATKFNVPVLKDL